MADEDKHCQTIGDYDCFICTKFKVQHIKMYSGDRKYCETVNNEHAGNKHLYMYCKGEIVHGSIPGLGDRNMLNCVTESQSY